MASTKQPSLVEEHFEPVMEDEDLDANDSDVSAARQSSDDEHASGKRISGKNSRVPRLYEVKDERHAEAFSNSRSLTEEDCLPLGERVAALTNVSRNAKGVKVGAGGSCEIFFISRSKAKYKEYDEDEERLPQKRRGVQSLKLKPDRSSFRGRGKEGSRGWGRGRGRR